MMERKKSLITLWQLTISSTLYLRASQIAPLPKATETALLFCFSKVHFSNRGCSQAADRAEKSFFRYCNVKSITLATTTMCNNQMVIMTMKNLYQISDLFLYSRGSFHDGDSALVRLWCNIDFNSLPFGTQAKSIFHTALLYVCMCFATTSIFSLGTCWQQQVN